MESYEVLGVFGVFGTTRRNGGTNFLVLSARLVLRRLFHGGIPRAPRVYGHISVASLLHTNMGRPPCRWLFGCRRVLIPSCAPHRYLNNPEAMGGAAYFGLALISGSKLVLALAVLRHLANWWFLSSVEQCVPNSRSPSSARTPLIDVLFPFSPSPFPPPTLRICACV